MERTIEVIERERADGRINLTVTPTRVTVKFDADIANEDQSRIIKFVTIIEGKTRDVKNSYRGRMGIACSAVTLFDNSRKSSLSFCDHFAGCDCMNY